MVQHQPAALAVAVLLDLFPALKALSDRSAISERGESQALQTPAERGKAERGAQ